VTTAPVAHFGGHWLLTGWGESCDQGCNSQGLVCDPLAMHRHNQEIDSRTEMSAVVTDLGATCENYIDVYGANADVPVVMINSRHCFTSSPTRSVESINCGRTTPTDRKRLCFCSPDTGGSGSAVPTAAPTTKAPPTAMPTTTWAPTVAPTVAPMQPSTSAPVFSARWALSALGQSCGQECSSKGLRCDQADFHRHNAEIDSTEEMSAIVSRLGLQCSQYNSNWGAAGDVPNILASGLCFVSDSQRTSASLLCGVSPASDKRRLCWCSDPEVAGTTLPVVPTSSPNPEPTPAPVMTTTTTTTPPTTTRVSTTTKMSTTTSPALTTARWALAGRGQSCEEGCASQGLACNATEFQRHNGDIDSRSKMSEVVTSVGKTCSWFIDNWGEAGDVPVTMPDNNGLCFTSKANRPVESLSCSAKTGADKQRLCYCAQALAPQASKPALALPAVAAPLRRRRRQQLADKGLPPLTILDA